MASFFGATDAVAAAIEIERKGHHFYCLLRDSSSGEAEKSFFDKLATEELNHEKIFDSMLQRIGGLSLPANSADEEYGEYVKNLIDSHSLFMPESMQQAKESPVNTAIQMEKDTLLFFLSLESMVPDSEKHIVQECANEEKKHLRRLVQFKSL